jgi:hypothetical protein
MTLNNFGLCSFFFFKWFLTPHSTIFQLYCVSCLPSIFYYIFHNICCLFAKHTVLKWLTYICITSNIFYCSIMNDWNTFLIICRSFVLKTIHCSSLCFFVFFVHKECHLRACLWENHAKFKMASRSKYSP